MSVFDYLSNEDCELIESYIDNYANYNPYCRRIDGLGRILAEWEAAKSENLFKMFNNQLILKKKFQYEKSKEMLLKEMTDLLTGSKTYYTIGNEVRDHCGYELAEAVRMFMSEKYLAENKYSGSEFTIPGSCTLDGKPFLVRSGCKTVKTLGKLIKATGWCSEEQFEEFRLQHSMLLNQKLITGTLCLSIHPLDYMTMSDNSEGWSSCMCWMEEPGCYRSGTVEMMNSPNVIVAYVESDNENLNFDYARCQWNSKKWRQLVMITPDLILGNKQYPYKNDFLEEEVLKWVKELTKNSNTFNNFSEDCTLKTINNNMNNYFDNGITNFHLSFNYMYNDIYGEKRGYLSDSFLLEPPSHYYFNYSGLLTCMWCGSEIECMDTDNYSYVCCTNCEIIEDYDDYIYDDEEC